MHARLRVIMIIRLSWIPVGVDHCRHCITCIGGRHSPNECGVTTRVYTLSSSPEVDSTWKMWLSIASSKCCPLKYSTLISLELGVLFTCVFLTCLLTFICEAASVSVRRLISIFYLASICYKTVWTYPPHLRHVGTLPWEIKNSNFLQIFSDNTRYGRKCKQIAF